ncbi:hypothetical protein MXB_2689 [Myxobolus squamalis]|nr:hypothetical protein MXB_2689 [Myxobolus squamalis]
MRINIFGFVCLVIYTSLFLFFSKKFKYHYWIYTIIFYGILVAIFSVLEHEGMVFEHSSELGVLANIFSIVAFASPLMETIKIMKKKSALSYNPILSFTQLWSSVAWFVVGILLSDMLIIFPNVIGALLSIFQLHVGFRFRKSVSKV